MFFRSREHRGGYSLSFWRRHLYLPIASVCVPFRSVPFPTEYHSFSDSLTQLLIQYEIILLFACRAFTSHSFFFAFATFIHLNHFSLQYFALVVIVLYYFCVLYSLILYQ